MKKFYLLFASLLLVTLAFAGNADLFELDEEAINNEFEQLDALENYVIENNFLTLTEVTNNNDFDLSLINTNSMGTSSQADFVIQWEGFLWGFLCCPIGFFVVAINKNKDYDNKISYWIGVAATSVVNLVYYVAVQPSYY